MNDLVRKIIRTLEACLGAVATVIALAAAIEVFRGEEYPELNKWCLLAAAMAVVAWMLEKLLQHYDDEAFEALEKELSEAKAPRKLSQSQKYTLRSVLSKYPGQNFRVVQVGFGDKEAAEFAGQITSALREAGWIGNNVQGVAVGQDTLQIHSGVAIWIGFGKITTPADAEFEKYIEGMVPVEKALRKAFEAVDIKVTGAIRTLNFMPCPRGSLEIIVGAKPSPED